MSPLTRPPPRFTPTLNNPIDPARISSTATQSKLDIDTMVDLVQRQVQPIFERRLQQEFDNLVRTMVLKQWDGASSKLQGEMEMLVRQAVLDVLAEQEPVLPARPV